MAEVTKKNWNEIVKESKGSRVFIPEPLLPAVKEWQKNRTDFNKLISQVSQREIELGVEFQNLVLSIRKNLSASQTDIWMKNVGIDTDALKDGVYIINIAEEEKPQR